MGLDGTIWKKQPIVRPIEYRNLTINLKVNLCQILLKLKKVQRFCRKNGADKVTFEFKIIMDYMSIATPAKVQGPVPI